MYTVNPKAPKVSIVNCKSEEFIAKFSTLLSHLYGILVVETFHKKLYLILYI